MQVIVCDDDIENLNEMIQVCYDVLAKGTEVRGFSDASMLLGLIIAEHGATGTFALGY